MRLLSLVLALSCIIATAAAAWQPQEFVIGGWAGPPPSHNTLETWQRVADCNFTFCGVRGGYSVEQNRTMLDLCQQAGTRALLVDSRIHWGMVRDDDWRDTVSAIVADYGSHRALYGYYLRDEPSYQYFEALGAISQEFARQDPEHLAYINLFPTYASVRQLGSPTYEDYLDSFINIVRPQVLSYDHYALLRDGGIRPDYFENLALIREYALKCGVPAWNIILSKDHSSYRQPTAADMRWQVYTSLAYGIKGIVYFTYWTSDSMAADGQYAIVDENGRPARLYPIVRQLNREMRQLGPTLLSLTSTGVYHTGAVPAGGRRLGTDAIIQPPGELPLVLGLFEDEARRQYAMVVNSDYREAAEFEAGLAGHVVAVTQISSADGSDVPLSIEGQRLALRLEPGGGALLRLDTEFEHPEPPRRMTRIDFQFDGEGDLEGWSVAHSLGSAVVQDGVLSMAVTGDDPYMTRSFLRVPADAVSVVRVRMRITGGNDEAQLFWGTGEEPGFSDEKYLNFPIQPDGEWHEYEVPLGEHPKWRGQRIQAIRLDPTTGAEEGARVEIDWIVGE